MHVFLRASHTTALLQGEDTECSPYVFFLSFTDPPTLHCRVQKSHFNACVDELTEHLNADVDNNGVLRELVWTDISEVLQRKIKIINAFKLNREAWAADGLIPFDRCVAVTLGADVRLNTPKTPRNG